MHHALWDKLTVYTDGSGHGRDTTSSGLIGSGTHGTPGLPGTHGTHGTSGYNSTTGGSGLTGKVKDILHGGKHHTETANRLDPHVSGSGGPLEHATVVKGAGSGLGSTGTIGGGHSSLSGITPGHGSTSGTASGPHSSSIANKADPRVDSDR